MGELNHNAELGSSRARSLARARLRALGESVGRPVRFLRPPRSVAESGIEAVVGIGSDTYALEWRTASDAMAVSAGIARLRERAPARHRLLLWVPHMGDVGRRLCEREGVDWFDGSGNARILGEGLAISVEGRPNRNPRRGRPSSAFAPRASRVARWLLVLHPRSIAQRDLVARTGLSKGFVSDLVARLEEGALVRRDEQGLLRVLDPVRLLEAWEERYDFETHGRLAGMIAPAGGPENLRRVHEALRGAGIRAAFTGLAGAWVLRGHAAFRLVTVYADPVPSVELLRSLGFHEQREGANVWIVSPRDFGVFDGATEREGLPVVHPIQVLLDLDAHPERADEAAEDLRSSLLESWREP